MTRIYHVEAQVASLVLVVIGIVLSLVGVLDLNMSFSRLVNSVVNGVNVDTDIGVSLLRGTLLLVLGIFLLLISLSVSELLENIYHQIEDAFLQ